MKYYFMSVEPIINNGNYNWVDCRENNVTGIFYKLDDIDKITAMFSSYEELISQFNINKDFFEVVVRVQKNDDVEYVKFINDVVYSEDAKVLSNPIEIINSTLNYLKENPEKLVEFNGINNLIANEQGLESAINNYFTKGGYKAYRDAYFTLKRLNINTKNNSMHK